MVIRRGSATILLIGAGGMLSGCALPFAGSLAFTDILTGISIFSTAATGKGATEIALDVMTGQDCRLLEGALREDRDFCEKPGSAATEEDFKGVVAWLEEDEPASPVPGETDRPHIMVADIGLPDAEPTQPVALWADSVALAATEPAQPDTVALASISELPDDWIVLAALQNGLGPAAARPSWIHAKLDSSPLPFVPASAMPEADLADWALQKMPANAPGITENALTLPPTPARHDIHWNNLWPAVDIENPPLQQDVLRRAVLNDAPATSDTEFGAAPLPAPAKPVLQAFLPPAPAKPQLHAFLPHPKKPVLQAAAPDRQKHARAEIDFLRPTPLKPQPLRGDGPVVALLPSGAVINRTR